MPRFLVSILSQTFFIGTPLTTTRGANGKAYLNMNSNHLGHPFRSSINIRFKSVHTRTTLHNYNEMVRQTFVIGFKPGYMCKVKT